MNARYQIVERERSGPYERETNHFFDVVESSTQQVIMTFQQERCLVTNRPRGDWSAVLVFGVAKVEFSADGFSVLFYVKGKAQPGKVRLP